MIASRRLLVWLHEQALPFALGLLACAISLILTMQYCRMLRGDLPGHLPEALGLLWEVGKYMFVTAGLAFLAWKDFGHKLAGFCFLIIAMVLVVGSIRASMHWLSENDSDLREKSTRQSQAYQALSQEIEALDTEYELTMANAKSDQTMNMRTRSIEMAKSAALLRERRSEIVAKRATLENSVPQQEAGLGSYFEYMAVSVMLEVVSIAAFAIFRLRTPVAGTNASTRSTSPSTNPGTNTSTRSTSPSTNASTRSTSPSTNPGTNASTSPSTNPGTNASTRSTSPSTKRSTKPGTKTSTKSSTVIDIDKYKAARELLGTGRVMPAYRDLKAKLKVGQKAVEDLFARLADEGFLVRSGRTWAVA